MPIFGALGDSLESAAKTDFFSWFHLERAGVGKDAAGHDVIEFKPSGEKFRSFASLRVTCDAAGRMLGLELVLSRRFIESAPDAVFAADYAKSSMLSAMAREDLPKVKTLAEEIEFGSFAGRPVILHADVPKPALPESPSAGYLTYLGKQEAFELQLTRFCLRLENRLIDEVSFLVLSLW